MKMLGKAAGACVATETRAAEAGPTGAAQPHPPRPVAGAPELGQCTGSRLPGLDHS